MLPDPLHPAIVHFPLVLAFLLPISAVIAIWTIRKGSRTSRAWLVPVAIAASLSVSSWVSMQTGEAQEERVERVVQEQPLEAHEEAAEVFQMGSIVVLLVTVAGVLKGAVGSVARVGSVAVAIALVAGAAYVGHTGGQLVYKHGAASAYASPGTPAVGDNEQSRSASTVARANVPEDDDD